MEILSYNFAIHFGFFLRGGNMGNKQKVTVTVDKGRLMRKLGNLEEDKIAEVNEAIKVSLNG